MLRRHLETFRQAIAESFGCAVADFDSERLVVVQRPPSERKAPLVHAVTFGTGTVFAAQAEVHDRVARWLSERAPRSHYRVMQPFVMADLAAALFAERPRATAHGFSILHLPATAPPSALAPPVGLASERMSSALVTAERSRGTFDNALGDPGSDKPILAAFAAVNEFGELAAVAGVWDEGGGRYEIGVDVQRRWRGQGLAAPVVAEATRWVLAAGKTPQYACGITNLRSQRVAGRVGYVPVATFGHILRLPAGEDPYAS